MEDWLVGRGLNVLFGASQVGKSFLAPDWSLSLTAGIPWLGHRVDKGRVLYVLAEDDPFWIDRVDAWCQDHGGPDISEIRFIAEPVNLYRAPAHSTSSFPAMQPEGGWGNDPAQGFVCQRVPQVSAGVLAYDRDPDPGYPGIDPWIIDIYDGLFHQITRPAGMFGASYAGFFDHDSGPGNAARVVYTATETGNHLIQFGSRGSASQRLGDWHLTVTEASAPFYDDYAADASTSGTVVVGGSVSGRIDSTPSWYNAGDTGGPNGYYYHEPGWTGDHWGYSCHRETGDGIELDGDTCDRDWFEVTLIINRTYKLQLESGADLLIDGVYPLGGALHQKGGGTYTAIFNGIHYISVAGTDGCSGLHGCTGSYTLSVTEE